MDNPPAMGFRSYLHELLRLQAARPARLPPNLVVLQRVPSTNAIGRRIARDYFADGELPPPSLVVAWEQTAGRGRRGRSWASPAGRGVYASLVTPLAGDDGLHTLPLLAAVGLCRAAGRHLPEAGPVCRLKWPNDLLLGALDEGGRKLGGVLIETERGEAAGTGAGGGALVGTVAVIGFGVNYRASPEVEAAIASGGAGALPAAALADESPEPPSLAALVGDLAAAVLAELEHLGDEGYAAREYQALSAHLPGEWMRCRDGSRTVEGVFLGFDRRGFLRLRPEASPAGEERELRLAAGEVLA
jgi:BirA family biotin operon repressor/biotin-[acetyl-CoA-carboxylase] ligase